MKTTIFAAAFAAAALVPAVVLAHPAGGADQGQQTAIQACTALNEYGPAKVVTAVNDGMGDYLIWLEDVDTDLWACNANADGDVYANLLVGDDLLEGAGADMLHLVSDAPSRHPDVQAERLCTGAAGEDYEVVATVDDGLGDYLVWLTADNETFIMCNASSDGALYTFEEVSMPINEPFTATEPLTTENEEGPGHPAVSSPARPTQFG